MHVPTQLAKGCEVQSPIVNVERVVHTDPSSVARGRTLSDDRLGDAYRRRGANGAPGVQKKQNVMVVVAIRPTILFLAILMGRLPSYD
jgi:hypothetical protein